MKYEIVISRVQAAHSDEWKTVIVMSLMREDGVEGDIWVCAGVPDYQRGSATAAATNRGYEDVWAFGDSLDTWCPAEFIADDPDDILATAYDAALETHRDYQRDPASCLVDGPGPFLTRREVQS